MNEGSPKLPEACTRALAEIEAEPLDLSPTAEDHLRTCPACREARVVWLAQAEDTPVLAPAGYFDRLPDRVLAKLPPAPRRSQPRHLVLWALAAGVMAAVGVGGYLAGRANRTPLVEATLAPAGETRDTLPDTPFQEGEDDYAQLPDLTPEQAQELVERVRTQYRP